LWCGSCEFCRRGDEALCVRFGIIGEHVRGTLAEEVCVPAANLAARPPHMSWEEAAAFPLTFLTAWRMLVTRARLGAGETVLVHGIGGGLALAALAIAKHLGATVFATSSSDEKLARATALGADAVVNYRKADVAREVRALTGKRGVDVVVETAGLATWMTSLRSCVRGGRIVTCGATTGPNPTEEVRLIFWNQLSILGSTMGSAGDWTRLVEAVQEGEFRPVIDSCFPLVGGGEAYERLASGTQFGKLVMVIGG
jgi:NADPH:quinone reductase-like Zn-dependent oxidoreductase